ncbi:hypothetical protein SLEP1_g7343 [Rubroshorea leprosula]|uniref:Uncharacterized protein n=1 Tax=Rubroshorea leprosula TaxID=152421 RepID=A0AAV5I4C8_9ROSI|nr:hypothetical protein SLEP1_g7343 [Rubroshorea leprosula]
MKKRSFRKRTNEGVALHNYRVGDNENEGNRNGVGGCGEERHGVGGDGIQQRRWSHQLVPRSHGCRHPRHPPMPQALCPHHQSPRFPKYHYPLLIKNCNLSSQLKACQCENPSNQLLGNKSLCILLEHELKQLAGARGANILLEHELLQTSCSSTSYELQKSKLQIAQVRGARCLCTNCEMSRCKMLDHELQAAEPRLAMSLRSSTKCRAQTLAAKVDHEAQNLSTSCRVQTLTAEVSHELEVEHEVQSSNTSCRGQPPAAELKHLLSRSSTKQLKHELPRSTMSCRAQTLAVEVEHEVQNLSTSCRVQTFPVEVSHELQRSSTKCRAQT